MASQINSNKLPNQTLLGIS